MCMLIAASKSKLLLIGTSVAIGGRIVMEVLFQKGVILIAFLLLIMELGKFQIIVYPFIFQYLLIFFCAKDAVSNDVFREHRLLN